MSSAEAFEHSRDGVVLQLPRRRRGDHHVDVRALPPLDRDHQVLLRFLAFLADYGVAGDSDCGAHDRLHTCVRIAQTSVVDTLHRRVRNPSAAIEAIEALGAALERGSWTTTHYGARLAGIGWLSAAVHSEIQQALRQWLPVRDQT